MARKSTKTTENPTEQITEALDTPVNLEWDVTAEKLNVPVPELQERVAAKLNDSTVFAWDNLPVEHEPVVEAIQRDLESEASVRRLEPQAEVQLPPMQEPPVLKEEPEAPKAKKGATPKQKSGALTKTRKAAIEQAAETVKQSGRTHELATSTLAVQKGTRKGAKLAALELQAEDAAYEHVKRQGLQRKIAKLQDELLEEENFDPNELLTALGVPTTQETQAELDELVGNVLGKLQTATTEILDNSWANGYDLEAATLNLDRLMNSYE